MINNLHDSIHSGVTFEELVNTIHSNEKKPVSPEKVMMVYLDIMALKMKDARHLLKERMVEVLAEVNR